MSPSNSPSHDDIKREVPDSSKGFSFLMLIEIQEMRRYQSGEQSICLPSGESVWKGWMGSLPEDLDALLDDVLAAPLPEGVTWLHKGIHFKDDGTDKIGGLLAQLKKSGQEISHLDDNLPIWVGDAEHKVIAWPLSLMLDSKYLETLYQGSLSLNLSNGINATLELDEISKTSMSFEECAWHHLSPWADQMEKVIRTLSQDVQDIAPGKGAWTPHLEKIKVSYEQSVLEENTEDRTGTVKPKAIMKRL